MCWWTYNSLMLYKRDNNYMFKELLLYLFLNLGLCVLLTDDNTPPEIQCDANTKEWVVTKPCRGKFMNCHLFLCCYSRCSLHCGGKLLK